MGSKSFKEFFAVRAVFDSPSGSAGKGGLQAVESLSFWTVVEIRYLLKLVDELEDIPLSVKAGGR